MRIQVNQFDFKKQDKENEPQFLNDDDQEDLIQKQEFVIKKNDLESRQKEEEKRLKDDQRRKKQEFNLQCNHNCYNCFNIELEFEKQLLKNPNDGFAFDGLGKLYFEADDYNKALHYLLKASEENCSDYYSSYLLGVIYDKRGNYKNAIFYLIDSIQRNQAFEKSYIKLGEIFLVKNEIEKALKYLRQSYTMNPYNPEVLNNLGLCYLNLGDFDQAIQNFYDAIKEDNTNMRAMNNMGNALRKKGQIAQAIQFYERAAKLQILQVNQGQAKEKYHIAHLNLASAYTEINNIMKAIEHLQQALENNHKTIMNQAKSKGLDYFLAHDEIPKIIVEYENKEYDTALTLIDKIYEFNTKNPVVNYYCAMANLKLGNINQALRYFPLVIQIFSNKATQGLEELKLVKFQKLREEKYQSRQAEQCDSSTIANVTDINEDEKASKIQSLHKYNTYFNKHVKSSSKTRHFQDVYSQIHSRIDSPPPKISNYSRNIPYNASINESSSFNILDLSTQREKEEKLKLRTNLRHPILFSPSSNHDLHRSFGGRPSAIFNMKSAQKPQGKDLKEKWGAGVNLGDRLGEQIIGNNKRAMVKSFNQPAIGGHLSNEQNIQGRPSGLPPRHPRFEKKVSQEKSSQSPNKSREYYYVGQEEQYSLMKRKSNQSITEQTPFEMPKSTTNQRGTSTLLNDYFTGPKGKKFILSTTSSCNFGNKCSFAHGANELRKIDDPLPREALGEKTDKVPYSNYKTIKCCYYYRESYCPFGIRCSYAHGDFELRSKYDPIYPPLDCYPPVPPHLFFPYYCEQYPGMFPSMTNSCAFGFGFDPVNEQYLQLGQNDDIQEVINLQEEIERQEKINQEQSKQVNDNQQQTDKSKKDNVDNCSSTDEDDIACMD